MLLPKSKQSLLRGFDDKDSIYEEFDSSTNPDRALLLEENNEKIFDPNWKEYRERPVHWLLKCFVQSFNMVVLCSLLVSAVSVIIMFVNINTTEVCFDVQWDNLPEKLKRVRVTVEVVIGWCLQYYHIVVMIFVFGFKLVDELHLLHLNVVAAFTDMAYRLFLQLYDNYGWESKLYILNAIFVGVMLVNSYTLAKHYYNERTRKIILTMQLGVQFILTAAVAYSTFYLFNPWFVKLEMFKRTVVAAVIPIVGVILKVLCRLTIHDIQINHPGTSYMLLAEGYIATSLVYRTIQAQIQKTPVFIILCLIQSVAGFVGQLCILFYRPLLRWLYKKVLKGNRYSISDPTITPRSQRLMADVFICNTISEINALIYTNAFVQLYAMKVGYENDGNKNQEDNKLKEFFLRTFTVILIECVFITFRIFIMTWFKNIPVMRVWRKKWKTFLGVSLCISASTVMYITHYLTYIVAGQVGEQLSRNKTLPCDLSKSLFL